VCKIVGGVHFRCAFDRDPKGKRLEAGNINKEVKYAGPLLLWSHQVRN
jgi:hypothetical protein